MTTLPQQVILKFLENPLAGLDAVRRGVLRGKKTALDIPKSDLLKAYHELLRARKIVKNPELEKLMIKRGVRTLSGVAIVTNLTKPYGCPGKCVYCPTEAQMPKSYLSDEPAAARALSLAFDPYEQTRRRIDTLAKNGHPTDKIELIIKGGTWNFYPLDYQYWFILRCFEAANGNNKSKIKNQKFNLKIKNDRSFASLRACPELVEGMTQKKLLDAQKKNETAKHRVIGLTLETRPDFINLENILTMRALGCTRVELGVQTIDDRILKTVKRGHDAQAVRTATALLKNFGFKVDYHLMPQLPGSTPAKDTKMMLEIFSNPDYRPDMIKIYPCTVVKNSELYDWLVAKKYRPYSDKKLIEVLKNFKATVPRYCRISRLIRDIPSHHIQAGNLTTNLRQVIQTQMTAEGMKCNCLRCREAGHQNDKFRISNLKFRIFIDKYFASGGNEYFISIEDKNRQVVFAFCRLRLTPNTLPTGKQAGQIGSHLIPNTFYLTPHTYPAFIRELHTYGQLVGISKTGDIQHTGMGKALIKKAEEICRKQRVTKLAVISGVGVRGYYRKLGYRLENQYMVKKLGA
ncbi:MAG: tRNA uridine(34) 5-carboxymethylaminomethyl modification radical SAM/GNAT enzyme Elp3 [Candidatus Magasanikbacteria bacterium]|jgi:elongator complex protein 3